MNILLIGNGFDLAHRLPTSYSDFLKFGQYVQCIFKFREKIDTTKYIESMKDWKVNELIKKRLKEAFENRDYIKHFLDNNICEYEIKCSDAYIVEVYNLINKNDWFEYFCLSETYMGKNWIDFENEISNVIRVIEEARNLVLGGDNIYSLDKNKSQHILKLLKASSGSLQKNFSNIENIEQYIIKLEKEMNKLIRALELYLCEFVEKIEITHKIKEVEDLNINKILSFNYTNTYKRVYDIDGNIEYNYIHGVAKVDNTIESNNMVLGINEYLEGEERDKNITFITFKKFFQRILKSTESKYYDWLKDIELKGKILSLGLNIDDNNDNLSYLEACATKEKEETNTLYIFGHSLDVTDSDILRKIICNDNIKTKIFYYREYEDDKRALSNQIKNLVKVIGEDELIKRTGGETRTIEFIPQLVVE